MGCNYGWLKTPFCSMLKNTGLTFPRVLDQVLDAHGLFSTDVHYREFLIPAVNSSSLRKAFSYWQTGVWTARLSAANSLCLVPRWERRGPGSGGGCPRGCPTFGHCTSATEVPRGCAAASPVALAPCLPSWGAPRPRQCTLSPRHRPRCRRGECRGFGCLQRGRVVPGGPSPAEQSTSCTLRHSALKWLMLCAVHGS